MSFVQPVDLAAGRLLCGSGSGGPDHTAASGNADTVATTAEFIRDEADGAAFRPDLVVVTEGRAVKVNCAAVASVD